MNQKLALITAAYGFIILLIGIVAVMYNPATSEIGYNAKAKSALISGGVCAGLAFVWAALLYSNQSWAGTAAMIMGALFLLAFAWRATMAWNAYFAGDSTKFFAASLISLMWVASVALVAALYLLPRRG